MHTLTKTLALFAALAAPRIAFADDAPLERTITDYAWHEDSLVSKYGVSTVLGGGVTGFTGKTMRDSTPNNVGGLWDLRITLGSHTPIGLDVGYIGSSSKLDALIGSKSGTLVGTIVEGDLRWNILPHYAWNPYVFAGMGWQRFDVTGAAFSMADTGIRDSDNSLVFPMGAGLSFRDNGLVIDVRGTFRASSNSGLVIESPGASSYAPMHSWEASGAVGYEF